jgi:hypothetical protein
VSEDEAKRRGPSGLALQAALLLATTGEEPSLDWLKAWLRREVDADPMDAMVRFAAGAAWLFYQAERGHNPRVESYVDALAYISTSMSVGYHEIHPRTQAGQVIASVVHMLGPSLAAGALVRKPEPPRDEAPQTAALVERLDAVLAELRALRVAAERTRGEPT